VGRNLNLFTPGPVNLSVGARRAAGEPLLYHRSAAFEEVWTELGAGLKTAFQTRSEVAILTASGTGAMEAVVANLFGRGDRVLVPVNGKFSRRWVEIAQAYGLEVSKVDLLPGESPTPERIADALAGTTGVSGVLLTQCETSTGSLTDVEAVAAAVREAEAAGGRPILVCSDSTTSLCVDELRCDLWGLDAVIGASQKGLLAPPGLSFVTLSERARGSLGRGTSPNYYFDLRKYYEAGRPPFTPAISLVVAARRSLGDILALGLERVWKANRAGAAALRAIVESAGLAPVAKTQAAAAVAFWTGDLPADVIATRLAEDHGILVAQGQEGLKGRVLRVSAMGKPRAQILLFAGALEAVVGGLGRRMDGRGLAADLEGILEDTAIWE
jgi:aspartate aminotransferase-like enzyme